MYDWIIEADAYRTRKAAGQATSPRERRETEALAERTLPALSLRRGTTVGGTGFNG